MVQRGPVLGASHGASAVGVAVCVEWYMLFLSSLNLPAMRIMSGRLSLLGTEVFEG